MLSVKNLSFAYKGSRPVLDHLTFALAPGRVCGLLGKNGAGKTTLLQLIAGALTPGSGEVLLNGADTRCREPLTMADLFIVPDTLSLPAVTVGSFAKVNSPFYPRFSAEAFAENLELFGIDAKSSLKALSLGQQKKAFMSFALACNTSLLLLDEPTNGLDIPSKESFRRFIASNMTDERSIIISTHQVRDLSQLLDHVIILEGNGIVLDSPVAEVSERVSFITSSSNELLAQSLYSRPTYAGIQMIVPNNDGAETDVDLEMLFGLATERPDIVRYLFNNRNLQTPQ